MLSVVVLAAGQGTRMRSNLPKVLHPIAGRPMLGYVLDAARALQPDALYVVHGHGGEQVRAALPDPDIHWVEQTPPRGTGHALQQAMPAIADDQHVLVLCGDVPLVRAQTLQKLMQTAGAGLGLLTVRLADPSGYGRIVRTSSGSVAAIVEERDASAAQRAIQEVNTGILCLPAGRARGWLSALRCDNAQGEYYLTDIVALARRDGIDVQALTANDPSEVQGVNDRAQLAWLERVYQQREAQRLMSSGVSLMDPARFDLRGRLVCGADVTIDVNCIFAGDVEIADGAYIGPNCLIRDSRIGANAHIAGHCDISGAIIESACQVGPFARLRPGTRLAAGAKVGNFVETKNSAIGQRSKVNHLSYVGDAELGTDVNVGAGTITCNYDGVNKHRTVIEDDAFIGSGTQLVAPVRVGRGATIGAGSTIRRDTPAGTLTVSGTAQRTITGWRRPTKNPKSEA
ncbi:MAG: bifunctional UDP-N-acetylglucosamine diphosphorylase/glucosamine-1-phosphate N-acetyltransferase GlmU [Nitrococcus mobilis]|nr:bifunctional UDP-N-acetylglucosamine diphosphorylase/glucosamine-1-phosphate N-acetyltransferase GlmU [Nitrococcus mobilis]